MKQTAAAAACTPGIPLLTYHEEGFREIERVWLNDDEYGRVLQSKVLANTDVILINPVRRTFYLAWRLALPAKGWFWMGGNTGNINLPFQQSVGAVLAREIGFSLPAERLTLRFAGEYFWRNRAQAPQDIGCHMCGITFSAEITEEEAARIKLDPAEYEGGSLVEFDREALVREGVLPFIIDAYDLIFPPCELQHVVLIKFREGTPESVKQEVNNRFSTLADDCGGRTAGILSFTVKRNLDLRKGVELVEIARFRDNDALQNFRRHPKHQEVANPLSNFADWQVGDIMV